MTNITKRKNKRERESRDVAFGNKIKREREKKKAQRAQESEPFNFADELFEESEVETPLLEERQRNFRSRQVEYTIENKWRFLNFKSFLRFLKSETCSY